MNSRTAQSETVSERLAQRIGSLIEQGLMKVGARLPSIRNGAVEFGVARNSVVEAYERLVALGYVRAERGSGFYVCKPPPRMNSKQPSHVAEAVDLVWLLREQLERNYAVRIGDGRPPQSWLEGSELGRFLKPADLRNRSVGDGYSSPRGYSPLLDQIAVMLSERSIKASAAQVLLTVGASQALDLVVRHLTQPGDSILVDDPGYYPLFGKLKLAMTNLIGVRRNIDGPDPDDLTAKAEQSKAKVFFTQSTGQNPTGGSISVSCAHRVLQVASRFGMTVVDDDPFLDINAPSCPRLAALDQLETVIQVGSFSKTLSASLRVGYIAASEHHVRALTDLKMLTIVNSSGYAERLVSDLISNGHYRRHLARLRQRLRQSQETGIAKLRDLGLEIAGTPPGGGYYVWAQLPRHVDDISMAKQAAAENIFVAPGSIFSPERKLERPGMRVNIAYAADERFAVFYRKYLKSV